MPLILLLCCCLSLEAVEHIVWTAEQGLPERLRGRQVTVAAITDGDRQALRLAFPPDPGWRTVELPWSDWLLDERCPPTGTVSHLLLRLRAVESPADALRCKIVGPGGTLADQRFVELDHYAVLSGEWIELRIPLADMVADDADPALALGDPLACAIFGCIGQRGAAAELLIDRIAFVTSE